MGLFSEPLLLVNSALSPPFTAVIKNGEPRALMTAQPDNSFSRQGVSMVKKTLDDEGLGFDDLGGFVFVLGPGSFTGIRVGLSMLKGMAFGRAVRAAGLSSLYIMARPFFGKASRICPLIDACLNHVYAALYDGGGDTVLEPRAEEPKSFFSRLDGKVRFVGPDAPRFAADMKPNPALSPGFAEPSEGDLVRAAAEAGWRMFEKGETRPVEDLEPLYLRPSYAEIRPTA